jgi:hypothetical protein
VMRFDSSLASSRAFRRSDREQKQSEDHLRI